MKPYFPCKSKTISTFTKLVLAFALSLFSCSLLSAQEFGDCVVTENPPIHKLDLKQPGVIDWPVPLPTPGAIFGDTPETVNGGYLYCLAAEIAKRSAATRIAVRNTTFEAIISGVENDFDFTVWDVIITPERARMLDFTVPYRRFDAAVVTLEGSDVTKDNLKDKRLGTLNGARQVPWIEEHIKPSQPLRAYNNNQDMITALIIGQIDAFIHDTEGAILFAAENRRQGLIPVGRLPIEFGVGVVLPKDSVNTARVNQIVEEMLADGTVEAIYEQWVYARWGDLRPEKIPLWFAGE